jgi:flagellar motor component MotA
MVLTLKIIKELFKTEKVNTIKKLIKNTLSIEEQDNVLGMLDFEKKQAEEERAKQVALN